MRLNICSEWQCDFCLKKALSISSQPPEDWQRPSVKIGDKWFESELCPLCEGMQLEPEITVAGTRQRVKWKLKENVA